MRQEKKSTPSSVRWRVSARLSTVLTAVVTAVTVLSLCGCVTARKSVRKDHMSQEERFIRHDSIARLQTGIESEVVEKRVKPVTVAQSEVTLTISVDSLRSLPQGASYSRKSGQASVKVVREAGTSDKPERIYVYATCDSLQVQCESYERTIRNMRAVYSEEIAALRAQVDARTSDSQRETHKDSVGMLLKRLLISILTAIVFIGIYCYIKKKERNE